jgi:hypothetical protein
VAERRNSFAEIVTAAVTIRVHKQLSLLVESTKRAEQKDEPADLAASVDQMGAQSGL